MVHFRDGDLSEVIDEFDRIAAAADGSEWITISPWVDAEHLPVRSALHRIFSARASKVPEATWVAAQNDEPAQLGVLHGTGAGALDRVHAAGFAVPGTWRKLGDHSKRGLLFAIHPDTTTRSVIEAALGVSRALADVPTDDRWVAQVTTSS